ncbi:hypothetical protein LIER_32568 [Lithospermum erythrorhizon]|uniref:RING-type E3 ubiquitin transferase n=1 Tax=Lithospermum erythrorhizon TaxID=34254 RepID=A0AAV3RXB5_LITER
MSNEFSYARYLTPYGYCRSCGVFYVDHTHPIMEFHHHSHEEPSQATDDHSTSDYDVTSSPNSGTESIAQSESGTESIDQSENESTQSPAPGAPSSAINAIPTITIKREHLDGDPNCTVCLEMFKLGSEAKELPACKHIFHPDCIVSWLVQHNSCPICRVQLR